ncbi:amidase [Pseudanabaena sp. UWO310]|uniref:amidase n=1 Tax=Pseudanabaena sp. UWO310 TaxID=2480795 RepID=UPI00115ABE30|nr:amidase [Pseudanabaena sp. UWO310]TYQ30970.1 amidase [Pseudanabaena sp. UWO310]
MSEIADLSAAEIGAQYRQGELSPVEVTKASLQRIEDYNDLVNAFAIAVDPEIAIAEAKASETRWREGNPLGTLDGIPFTAKDLLLSKGLPTRRGSKAINPDQAWDEDAPAVARLREQGAILLGKTTTSEFGYKGVTDSPLTGITRNPWNINLTPGGSSGGAAVAAALGFGILHLGTDGGGSVRAPASLTGVFGIKPTFGRVAGYPIAHTGTVFHVGVLSRTVADAALTLNAIAHPDVRDWYALPDQNLDYTANLDQSITGLRIAFSANLGYADVDPEVADLVKKAVAVFAQLGAIVEEVDPNFPNPRKISQTLWQAGAAKLLRSFTPEQRAVVEEGLRATAAAGDRLTLAEYINAQDAREALGRHLQKFHQNYDLLLTPTLAIAAFPVGLNKPPSIPANVPDSQREWSPFTYIFNLTQQPAASIPIGFTKDGLPVGLQIVAAKYNDALVLQAAKAYENIAPFALPLQSNKHLYAK